MHVIRFTALRLCVAVGFVSSWGLNGHAAETAYVSSETAGVGVIDLARMTLVRTYPLGADRPRGLSLTEDGKRLLLANKATGDMSIVDTRTGRVLERIPIGKNPEFVRVAGHYAYVTYEPDATMSGVGGPPSPRRETEKLPAEIAVVDVRRGVVVRSIKSGYETEGVEFSRDGRRLLVTNEGDDTVSEYDSRTGAAAAMLRLPKGSRPRGIQRTPDGKHYVVTLEQAGQLAVLDATDLHVTQIVKTQAGPYGVGFDPTGQHLLVAAARAGLIQVFDAKTYVHLNDFSVGKRCWHFSFTPSGKRLLVACGRSNAVFVLDMPSGRQLKRIDGLPLAWGIVTYPRSAGSIDVP